MRRALILTACLTVPITALSAGEPTPHAGAAHYGPPVPVVAPATPVPFFGEGAQVTFETEDDLTIHGAYFAPRKKSKLAPAALLIHDAGGSNEPFMKIAERLQKQGFGVLAIDLRGHGKSVTKDLDWSKMDEEGRKTLWAYAMRDVEAAAKWLRKQENIHSVNLSLVGYGSGCALAVRHARNDLNVKCVTLLEPNAKDLGFNVASDILDIEGVQTLVLSPRPPQPGVEKMVADAKEVSVHPYIELMTIKPKVDIISDRSTPAKVAKWLAGNAMEKKGK